MVVVKLSHGGKELPFPILNPTIYHNKIHCFDIYEKNGHYCVSSCMLYFCMDKIVNMENFKVQEDE